ncbi:EEF1E1 (predicted) [Pycnogonum litorale]
MADLDLHEISRFYGHRIVESKLNVESKLHEFKTDKGLKCLGKWKFLKQMSQGSPTSTEEALINQLLELKFTKLDRCATVSDLHQYLKDLDGYMLDKVYVAGNRFTVADLVLYHYLHSSYEKFTFQEKQTYQNLSRWFDFIQSDPKIRQDKRKLIFSQSQLY